MGSNQMYYVNFREFPNFKIFLVCIFAEKSSSPMYHTSNFVQYSADCVCVFVCVCARARAFVCVVDEKTNVVLVKHKSSEPAGRN